MPKNSIVSRFFHARQSTKGAGKAAAATTYSSEADSNITTHKPLKQKKLRAVHVQYKEREFFTENLAMLLKAAVPVGQALDSLVVSARTKSMKTIISRMKADIEEGYSLANALERSRMISSQTLALVRLGEQSGHLVENMQLAARQEEKRHIFRSKVRSALM